jgi:hypothetical protein
MSVRPVRIFRHSEPQHTLVYSVVFDVGGFTIFNFRSPSDTENWRSTNMDCSLYPIHPLTTCLISVWDTYQIFYVFLAVIEMNTRQHPAYKQPWRMPEALNSSLASAPDLPTFHDFVSNNLYFGFKMHEKESNRNLLPPVSELSFGKKCKWRHI